MEMSAVSKLFSSIVASSEMGRVMDGVLGMGATVIVVWPFSVNLPFSVVPSIPGTTMSPNIVAKLGSASVSV